MTLEVRGLVGKRLDVMLAYNVGSLFYLILPAAYTHLPFEVTMGR